MYVSCWLLIRQDQSTGYSASSVSPYTRNQHSSGKVEAGVKYVKGNALAGEVFDDWCHLEAHVRQWLDGVANVRRHGTTGEMPRVRFERDEQDQLGPYLTPATLCQDPRRYIRVLRINQGVFSGIP